MRRDLSTLLDQYRPPFGERIGIATPIRIATRIPITDARLRRYKRIGAVAGARKDLPKTHKSRSRQETSPRRPRTTASDGRAASRALGRPAWRGDGGHFSSRNPFPPCRRRSRVDKSSVTASTIAQIRNRDLLGECNIDAFSVQGEPRSRPIAETSGVSRFRRFIAPGREVSSGHRRLMSLSDRDQFASDAGRLRNARALRRRTGQTDWTNR